MEDKKLKKEHQVLIDKIIDEATDEIYGDENERLR